jgi:hypothetical protein
MAQADQSVQNATFPTVRADINDNLAALFSDSSGNGAPSVTVAFQDWIDTSGANPLWKKRNAANNAWVTIGTIEGNEIAFEGTLPDQSGNSGKYLSTDGTDAIWTDTPKAWVDFATLATIVKTGTYSRSLTTVTVTSTAHGLTTGDQAYLDFTSGAAVDDQYTVTVTGVNTFTVTTGASGSTSGNVTIYVEKGARTIRGSSNVSSVTADGDYVYTINFTTALPDANYAALVGGEVVGVGVFVFAAAGRSKTAATYTLVAFPNLSSSTEGVSLAIFR